MGLSDFMMQIEETSPWAEARKVVSKVFINDYTPSDEEELKKFEEIAIELSITEPLVARVCFERLFQLDKRNLRSVEYVESTSCQVLERWHFRMLNDKHRNQFFRSAIDRAHRKFKESAGTECRLMDIGTGSGLLSVYAHELGVHTIVACDECDLMGQIAEQTFAQNDCSNVRLIKHNSRTLDYTDIGGPVDIIVTEILDCAGYGEGILQTLLHAKEHLLKPGGQIIPGRIDFIIAGYDSNFLAQSQVCVNDAFLDATNMKDFHLFGNATNNYETEHCTFIPMDFITEKARVYGCDFNDENDMRAVFNGRSQRVILPLCKQQGHLDGFILWFELGSDFDRLCTRPDPSRCWAQVLFRLNNRFNISGLSILEIDVSYQDGGLVLNHAYNKTVEQKSLEIGGDVVRFINDAEYLSGLDRVFEQDVKAFSNVLDFSTFPYSGIKLLKAGRAKKLYCNVEVEKFVTVVANQNNISLDDIVFLIDPADVTDTTAIDELFDVIIIAPIELLGYVHYTQVVNYDLMKKVKLSPDGIIIPHRVEVWCQPVESEWLRHSCRLENKQLDRMGISQQMNRFQTTHQLCMTYYDGRPLTEPVLCGELQLNDEYYEQIIPVQINPPKEPTSAHRRPGAKQDEPLIIDGLAYSFKSFFAPDCTGVSTLNPTSHINQAIFVMHPTRPDQYTKRRGDVVKLRALQNNGVLLLRCE